MLKRIFMHLIASGLLIGLSYSASTQANPRPDQLSRCQHIKTQLDEVKEARRSGGSSRYLRYLKKERNRLDKRYSKYRCYRIRSYLK